MRIVNLSELDPAWNWLAGSVRGPEALAWSHSSALAVGVPRCLPRSASVARALAAWRAVPLLAGSASSLLVSHGPRMTMYGAQAARLRRVRPRHLAYSFNFTQLPHGSTRKAMAKAFAGIDRFVCFSNMERRLYADHFGLDIERIDMIHWAARPPQGGASASVAAAGEYVCALGSQGRDYGTLFEAMRTLPSIRLVVVATPASLAGLAVPDNVTVLCNIPLGEAMAVLRGSRFTIVPLGGHEVPCGHVTVVSAMHCSKAAIVSASSGMADYLEHGVNGLTVPVGDRAALARAIEQLWSDPVQATRLGAAARAFAAARCGEDAAVAYLENYLRSCAAQRA